MSISENVLKKYVTGNDMSFVETGTSLGDTVALADKLGFKKIHSIEFYKNKFDHASDRFKKHKHVKLHNGDSGTELSNVLTNVNGDTVIFLDSHFSCDNWTPIPEADSCPIMRELEAIGKWMSKNKSDKTVYLLIDDIRIFNKAHPGWHSLTLNNILGHVKHHLGDFVETISYEDGVTANDIMVVKMSRHSI